MKSLQIAVCALLFFAAVASAQEAEPKGAEEGPGELLLGLQDNSFLLEEGYNQEPGIVQHINVFQYSRDEKAWEWAFTQEWPIASMKHQFSYTVPTEYLTEGEDDGFDLGDIALNYRYQLIGNGESRVAVSPRLSVFFPTSDDTDDTAWEVGIPISTILGSRAIAHTNVAAKWTSGDDETEYTFGQSVVLPVTPNFNFLVEGLWKRNSEDPEFVLSPGIRWAHNLASGTQIVPGLAYIKNMDDDDDDSGDAILIYFSIENAFGGKRE